MSHTGEICDRCFGSWDAARQHMDALYRWDDEDDFECDKCDRTFTTQDGCNQHMTAPNHWFDAFDPSLRCVQYCTVPKHSREPIEFVVKLTNLPGPDAF